MLVFFTALPSGAVAEDASSETPETYFLQGKWQKAAKAYSAIPEPSQEDMNKLGEAYFYGGDYDSAEKSWKKALTLKDNETSKAHLSMLKAIYSKRELQELEKTLETKGGSALLWRAAGIAKMKSGDDERALYYFYEAVERDPTDYMSYFYIGTIYENHFAFDDSAKAYKKVLEINPVYAQALNNLGYSYKEMRFWSYAADYYAKALEIWPDNSSYHYNIGNAYMHKGMPDRAFDSYKRAVELDPYFAKAHYNLGKAYLRRGMLEEAVAELKLYVKLWSPAVNPLDAPLPKAVKKEIKEIEEVLREERKWKAR